MALTLTTTAPPTPTVGNLPAPGDYQPLKAVGVPGAEIMPRGLVLVVGPNSSGKTQLLKDIHAVLAGEQRAPVVCEHVTIGKPPEFVAFINDLVEKQQLRRTREPDGNEYLHQHAPLIGSGDFRSNTKGYVGALLNSFDNLPAGLLPLKSHTSASAPFFHTFGHSLVTALFLDRRLNTVNQSQSFDYETEPPKNEVQSLYVNEKAQQELMNEIKQVFGKGVWLDNTRSNLLCLRVNQLPEIPPAEERLQPQRMKDHRTIETEGDGLRSYVGICVSLLLGLRPVCLIDEPELCLHPPQAYRMGLFIGRHGTTQNHAILTSTHSSHVLRGVIEATGNVQILRLTKYANRFKGHLIGPEVIRQCMDRPIIRAETILDGIFADGVALVEADGDRAVYQAAWEAVTKGRPHRDVLFIPVGGTGGFAEIAGFYRRLQIPVAVVADLDLLADPDKLALILKVICDREQASEILSKCRDVAKQIKEIPPRITPDQVRERLLALADGPIDWTPKADEQDDDVKISRALNGLAKEVNRLRHLKAGGVEGLKDHRAVYEGVKELVEGCKRLGIYLVPVGEVEQWQPAGLTGAPSQRKKAEWANWAAAHIRQTPAPWNELQAFIKSLEVFEKLEAQRVANE